jgi:hypothetical protein
MLPEIVLLLTATIMNGSNLMSKHQRPDRVVNWLLFVQALIKPPSGKILDFEKDQI